MSFSNAGYAFQCMAKDLLKDLYIQIIVLYSMNDSTWEKIVTHALDFIVSPKKLSTVRKPLYHYRTSNKNSLVHSSNKKGEKRTINNDGYC